MAKRSWWLAGFSLCILSAMPSPTAEAALPANESATVPVQITNHAAIFKTLKTADLNAAKSHSVAVRLRTLKSANILLSGADLKIAGYGVPTQSLWLKPVQDAWIVNAKNEAGAAAPIRVASNDLNVVAQAMTVDNEAVPENTSLSVHGSNIDVIAHLDLETYLMGVLPAEMPSSWPIEALKAQAIAARTFAVKKMKERGERSFQLDSTVNDQMYKYREPSASIIQAVNETRGQILIDANGSPIEAYFHADCGGQTELASNVWTAVNRGEQKSASDVGCKFNPKSHWSYQIETNELYLKLSAALDLPKDGEFVSIKANDHTDSGRINHLALSFKDNGGEIQERLITGQLYRSILGFDRVKSTLFAISMENGKIQMVGRGLGHGVGLCQQGAKGWALRGLKATEILSHYYPASSLALVR